MKEYRKNSEGVLICEECHKLFKNRKSLGPHITKYHKIYIKDYFDKWLKDKNDGKCQICNKETDYDFRYNKYKNCCSQKCSNIFTYNKIKDSNLKNFGVENSYQRKNVKEKIEQFNLLKYGLKHNFLKDHPSRKKWENNLIEKEGIKNVFQRESVKNKIKETNIIKFKCENAAQNLGIFEKTQKNARKIKPFRNTNLWYQGSYELDFLEKYYDKYPDIQRGPSIKYFFKEKIKYYFPDFYIPSLNLIIEIKNSYLYNRDIEIIRGKEKATLSSGFFFILILDKKYSIFEIYLQK